ncbi:hypothetical protein C8Q72DRAFT_560576 [Fomitopsis betulina]|nr:hypothetical protein C8Q72DRAFT_560576 [Fomitopsis betulina]
MDREPQLVSSSSEFTRVQVPPDFLSVTRRTALYVLIQDTTPPVMRFASAFSLVLAAVAAVPAMAWRSSYQERSLDAYGEPLAARGWSDAADLVARDAYDDPTELYARTSYDAYSNARMQRREDARILARELVDYLYGNNMRPVSLIQQQPGSDGGLYHWKLLIGSEHAAGTVGHDIVWANSKHNSLAHRGPTPFSAAATEHTHIQTWHLANIDAAHIAQLNAVAAATPLPKRVDKDINRDSRAWIAAVVKAAVAKKILPASAVGALAKVPKA